MILVSLNKLSAFLSTFVLCLWFVSVSNDDAHNICDHEDHLGTVGGNYHDIFCSRWSQLCIQYNIFAVVISQSAAEIGMVIVGHMSSKSAFGAKNTGQKFLTPKTFDDVGTFATILAPV